MIIKSLKLKNFRNYNFQELQFDDNVNIFYGDNAQGKTNILEAIYLCATTKSHRGRKDKELIRFDCRESHIEMEIEKKEVPYKIDIHLKDNGPKGIAINKIPIKKASELFGIVNVIFFSPEDLNIVKNGPSERRRFMDIELSQLDRLYLSNLSNYNRVMNQRNHLLKEINRNTNMNELEGTLDIWDMQLAKYGSEIVEKRKEFISKVNKIISKIHFTLSGNKEKVEIIYNISGFPLSLEDNLRKNRERDIRMKSTSVGPHRDDLIFQIEDKDVKIYGSQGQQRTTALSLKLSEIELVKESIKDTPILLLDDVLSELDHNRQTYLLESIHDIQTLISCTGLDEFINYRFSVNKIFHVEKGSVVKEN